MSKTTLTKKDVLVLLGCLVFVLANLGAVGSTGRRRAKEAVCLSNLLKWGIIWKSYTQDRHGLFPPRGGGSVWGEVTMGAWPYAIYDYMPSVDKSMLLCPAATKPYSEGGRPPFASWDHETDGVRVYASYTVNLWVAALEADGGFHDKFWQSPAAKGVAYTPLLIDGNWKDSEPEPYDEAPPYDGYWWEPNRNEMKRVCVNRHRGAVNAVLLDFSARKVALKELWKLKWHREWPEDFPPPVWPPWMENFKDY